jgi:hypothetical protein
MNRPRIPKVLTREQQIEGALRILKPALHTPADSARAREYIVRTLNNDDEECGYLELENEESQRAISASIERSGPTRQVLAVVSAHSLLWSYGLPVTCTRTGLWHQLSAIFFGDENRDLFVHMQRMGTQ